MENASAAACGAVNPSGESDSSINTGRLIGESLISSISLTSCLLVLTLSARIVESYRHLFGYVAFADLLTCLAYLWTTLRESTSMVTDVPAFVCYLEYGFGQFAYFSKFISPALPAITRYYVVCQTRCQRYFDSGPQLRRLVIATNLFLLAVIAFELVPVGTRRLAMPSCQCVMVSFYPLLFLVGVCFLSFVVSVHAMWRIYQKLNEHSRQLRLLNDRTEQNGGFKTQVAHKRILITIAIQTFTPILLALPLLTVVAAMSVTALIRVRVPDGLLLVFRHIYDYAFVPVLFSPLIDSIATVALVTGYRAAFVQLIGRIRPNKEGVDNGQLAEDEEVDKL